MGNLLFVILLLMTLIAGFIPFRFQQVTELGSVGIVALDALSSLERGMNARFIHPYLIFTMAGIADFISFFFQNQFRNETMAQMAIFALFLFNNTVGVFHPQIFFHKLFVTIEAIFLCKSLPRTSSTSQGSLPWCFSTGI
jgi:hypothetical protein